MTLVDTQTRVGLRNILFATDFSSPSEQALPYALSIARHYDSRVFVLHVMRPDLFEMVPPESSSSLLDQARVHAEKEMTNLLISGQLRDVPHQVLLTQGDLWAVIAEVLQLHQIDLVVVGTHGRTGARKILLGSAAEEIFRLAECPVLTVGPRVTGAPPSETHFSHILYATDFTSQSEAATSYAFSLAQEHGAHLTLLHVVKEGEHVSEQNGAMLQDFFRRRLRGLVPEGAEAWCDPEVAVEFGMPAEMILKAAAERRADLIVLGIRRSATFAGHLPPATAYKVVCQSHCPVLTVRSTAR